MKHCCTCDKWKDESEFRKCAKRLDGLRPECKSCERDYYRTWREKNPNYDHDWRVRRGIIKSRKERQPREKKGRVYKKQIRPRGRKWNESEIAKENSRAYDRRYKAEHPEKVREHWTTRRARKQMAGGVITAAEIRDLFARYGNRCVNPSCLNPYKPLTLDHVVPLAQGGSNTIDNAQPLCRSCNCKKGTKIIDYRMIWQKK